MLVSGNAIEKKYQFKKAIDECICKKPMLYAATKMSKATMEFSIYSKYQKYTPYKFEYNKEFPPSCSIYRIYNRIYQKSNTEIKEKYIKQNIKNQKTGNMDLYIDGKKAYPRNNKDIKIEIK
ncbi:MAG: hypothetical protein MR902_07970 [Campylobacter sp.]|nr:hypothetical protein [Campylobacter sp.]